MAADVPSRKLKFLFAHVRVKRQFVEKNKLWAILVDMQSAPVISVRPDIICLIFLISKRVKIIKSLHEVDIQVILF
jgi:hypothetical protein